MTTVEGFESSIRAIEPVPVTSELTVVPSRLFVAKTTANTSMHTQQETAPDIKVGRRPHLSIYPIANDFSSSTEVIEWCQ
jgi:hypothetical protein